MTTPDQFVHPIYRFLWPTPQSIFFPVSHRTPSKEALLAQLYSTILYRYVHIDARSNTMRIRHDEAFGYRTEYFTTQQLGQNTTLSDIPSQFSSSSSSTTPPPPPITTTTTSTSPTPAPTSTPLTQSTPLKSTRKLLNRLNRQLKFTPSPQFPHQALMLLFWFHLSMAKYPSTAGGLDLETYGNTLSSPWALTKLLTTSPITSTTIARQSNNHITNGCQLRLVSETGMDQINIMVERSLGADHDHISSNTPMEIGPIPASHREQLHSQFFSTPVDRVLYPMLDQHRVPLPLSEATFIEEIDSEVNVYQNKELNSIIPLNKTEQPLQTSPSQSNAQELHSIISSVHSILKQQLPIKNSGIDVGEIPSCETTEDDHAGNTSENPRTTKIGSNKRGTRTIALRHPDVDTFVQDVAEKKAINTSLPSSLSTSPLHSSATMPTVDVINPAWSQGLVTKIVKGSHVKTKTKLLKSSQYLLFGSQLLLQRYLMQNRNNTQRKYSKKKVSVVDDSDGVLEKAGLIHHEITFGKDVSHFQDGSEPIFSPFTPQPTSLSTPIHLSNVAKVFYDLILESQVSTQQQQQQQQQQQPTTINHVKINPKKRTVLPTVPSLDLLNTPLHQIIGPSYDTFNRTDHFKVANCLYDNENNIVGPDQIIGDVSPTSTTQSIQATSVAHTQTTPSSVIISCSPEKPEVWGSMIFALSLLNAKVVQNQMALGRTALLTMQNDQQTSSMSTQPPMEAIEDSIDNHPALPPVNTLQPNTIAVEARLLTLLHQFYNQSSKTADQTTNHLQRDYTSLTRSLPLSSSFYDEGVYHYLAHGLQTPQNTFYLPSPGDQSELLRAHHAVIALREQLDLSLNNNGVNTNLPPPDLTITWSRLQLLFSSLTPPIEESTQRLYLNVLTHSVPYPLSSSPTSPQSLFHFAFDTDAAPYCYVPKVIQGVFSPASTRPTLLEHQQLSFTRSFKRKNQIGIDTPTLTATASDTPLSTMSTTVSPPTTPATSITDAQPPTTTSTNSTPTPPPNTYPQLPLGDISFNMLWTWRHSTVNHQYLHYFQKVNHFQRSGHLTRKDALSKNIMRFIKPFTVYDQRLLDSTKPVNKKSECSAEDKEEIKLQRQGENLEILPHSYVFPLDLKQFTSEYQSRQANCLECGGSGRTPKLIEGNEKKIDDDKDTTQSTDPLTQPCSCQLWIIKPVNSSRGRGIFITDDVSTFAQPYLDFYDGVSFQSLYGGAPKKQSNATTIEGTSSPQSTSNNNVTSSPNGDDSINNNDKVFKFAETTDFPPVVVQHYINNPLLLHKRKFDLRIYVLVVSFEPLEAYVYNEGYARFAGSEFSADITNLHGHLTNSSLNLEVVQQSSREASLPSQQQLNPTLLGSDGIVNTRSTETVDNPTTTTSQFSTDFHKSHSVPNPTFAPSVLENTAGSNTPTFDNCKQLFSEWLLDMTQTFGPGGTHHGSSCNPKVLDPIKLLRDIDRTILNSLLVVGQRIGPQSNAFELFGYDIMIDDNYRPWLLEVNSSPSLNLNTDIDTLVKPQLLADTVSLVGLLPYDRSVLAKIVSGLDGKTSGPTEWNFKSPDGLSGGSLLLEIDKSADSLGSAPHNISNHHRSAKVDTEESNTIDFGQPGSLDIIKKNTFYQNSNNADTPTFHDDPINHLFSNLLSNFRTRFYGELPVNIGNYRRLAPNGTGSVWAQQLPFKALIKRFSNPSLPNGMKLKNSIIAANNIKDRESNELSGLK